jgi:hypothetical protein
VSSGGPVPVSIDNDGSMLVRASMGTLLIYLKPKCEKHESALRKCVVCTARMGS